MVEVARPVYFDGLDLVDGVGEVVGQGVNLFKVSIPNLG